MPSIPGIRMSVITISGWYFSHIRKASSALAAAFNSLTSSCSHGTCLTRPFLITVSSSTMIAFNIFTPVCFYRLAAILNHLIFLIIIMEFYHIFNTDSTKENLTSLSGLRLTPWPVTRFAMHRNDAFCIISRRMSRDFRAYSTKTPRGIVPCEQ